VMGLLGQTAPEDFRVVSGTIVGRPDRRSTFLFVDETGHRITYTIRIACTGIGSMAIFAGLVGAIRAPLVRKIRALAVSLPVIYVLNLVRNTFIGLAFGQQRLHIAPDLVLGLFSSTDPYLVSYFIADRILAQSLSVLLLIGITWLVVRELPETMTVVEDLLYVTTGTEYDLEPAIDRNPVRRN
jgi:archaeosortase A (PGF-CTERM-specific)